MQDRDLLREYLLNHSEPAFAELVARHVNLVFACARRIVLDEDLAKDVTQTVFIHLAKNAASVRDGDALGGWLYRAACNTATSMVRSESRRRHRETTAMNLADLENRPPAAWLAVAPLLEEAMQRLSVAEQDAVILRYFEGKSLREVGVAQNLSDDAAQKRISRALDKIRLYFTRHGVTVSVALLASVLAASSVSAAPAGLATGVAGSAFASAGGAAATGLAAAATKKLLAHKIRAALGVTALAALATVGWQYEAGQNPTEISTKVVAHLPKSPGMGAEGVGTATFAAPIDFAWNGNEAKFSLHTTQTSPEETIMVAADGTATATDAGFYLQYSIDCQIYGAGLVQAGQLPAATDEINIQSAATLAPEVPFVLWRSKSKTIVMQTDGQTITLQIIRTGQ